MTRLFCAYLALTTAVGSAAEPIDVAVTSAMREYCHIIRFDQGWRLPPDPRFQYNYNSAYEFRVPGLLETKFLIRGLSLPYKQYTVNLYEVDLSDPKALATPANEDAWRSAIPVRVTQKEAVIFGPKQTEPLKFNGFDFSKSGKFWADSRVSPDRAKIALQSRSGRVDTSEDPFNFNCLPFGCRGKLFFDVFNAENGKKILSFTGNYSGPDPDSLLVETGWVTERYFIIPLGEHRDRCLVCEFGEGKRRKQ